MGLSTQVERRWIVLYLLCPSCSQTLISYCIIMTSLNEHLAMASSEEVHYSACGYNFPNIPHFLCHTEVEQSLVLVTSWCKGEAWAPMCALAKDYTECQLSSDSVKCGSAELQAHTKRCQDICSCLHCPLSQVLKLPEIIFLNRKTTRILHTALFYVKLISLLFWFENRIQLLYFRSEKIIFL